MNSEHEGYQDEEPEDSAGRGILATRWVRAGLVLAGLAVVVVALPFLLEWFSTITSPRTRPGHMIRVLDGAPPPVGPAAEVRSAPESAPPPAPRTAGLALEAHAARGAPERPLLSPARSSAPRPARPNYWVQLGLFKDSRNADDLARRLRQEGVAVQVVNVTRTKSSAVAGGTYHLVRAGAFRDLPRAAAVKRELQFRGHSGFIIEGRGW